MSPSPQAPLLLAPLPDGGMAGTATREGDDMSEQIPNVSDPDVREMVLRNHEPTEYWTSDGRLNSVHCSACGSGWPCPSIQAAREREKETT